MWASNGATCWFPATRGAIQPRSDLMLGCLVSQAGISESNGRHALVPGSRAITVPPRLLELPMPPRAISHNLGAPNTAYCMTPQEVIASS